MPTPTNDEFAGRIRHTGSMARLIADTSGALRDSYEPAYLPGGYAFAGPVWWTFVPSRSGTIRIMQGSSTAFTPYVFVYTGTDVANLTVVAQGNFNVFSGPYIDFTAVAGQV